MTSPYLKPGPGLLEHVRGAGHRFLPAGDHDVEVACPDDLIGERDRVEPGQAHLVDGQGGHGHRDAAGDRGLAGGDLPCACGENLTHDDVLDLIAGDPRLVERRLDRDAAEVGSGELRQRSHQSADRGTCSGDDDRRGRVGHDSSTVEFGAGGGDDVVGADAGGEFAQDERCRRRRRR